MTRKEQPTASALLYQDHSRLLDAWEIAKLDTNWKVGTKVSVANEQGEEVEYLVVYQHQFTKDGSPFNQTLLMTRVSFFLAEYGTEKKLSLSNLDDLVKDEAVRDKLENDGAIFDPGRFDLSIWRDWINTLERAQLSEFFPGMDNLFSQTD